ncbi:uncharacterized protein LOC126995705 isoform X1 [Eriocheir sinensis]|uniref:uncharacterized protein LOC126995705 isoform X1 n=2 Tax=Eriocheir sinensis TaxID=95602 RepID=UPI0021C837DB|nr:uncharacterized protein LOC126995705 isoform X1 [Eriocheir sinensis]
MDRVSEILLFLQCYISSPKGPPPPCAPVLLVTWLMGACLAIVSAAHQACFKLAHALTEILTRAPLQQPPPPPKMEEDLEERLLAEMSSIAAEKWTKQDSGAPKVPKSMVASVRRIVKSVQSNSISGKSLLDFAYTKTDGEEKLLKVTSASVPNGILPEGYVGVLHDIKVSGRQADDSIYSNHPDIRQKIPRGTTVMDLKHGSDETLEQDIVIYANRKFTGSIGDEDDLQPENNDQWKKYFLKDQEEARQVLCMEKVNGEAAHFSGRFIENQFYIITGSKNVHMIIKKEEDIDKYEGERYNFAKVVARCVWHSLQALEDGNRKFLQRFLDKTKCTAICELLQRENQHIISLDHLEEPLLTVIGFTPTASNEEPSSLVAIPPHHTLDLLSCLGFTVPTHTVIPVEELQRHREEIRLGYQTEGKVLYFLDKDEETIGLVKIKTMWYIMLRALREKLIYTTRRRQGWTVEDRIESAHKRFKEIQEWLLFSDNYLDGWKELASTFMKSVDEKIKEDCVKLEEIRPTYPTMWKKFLQETNRSDIVKP